MTSARFHAMHRLVNKTSLTASTQKTLKTISSTWHTFPLPTNVCNGFGLILAIGRMPTLICESLASAAFCAIGLVGFKRSSRLVASCKEIPSLSSPKMHKTTTIQSRYNTLLTKTTLPH